MDRKYWLIIFVIIFTGMCGVISVDNCCNEITGQGGKIGLKFDRTSEDRTAFCFFGLEGEIGR